jgi:hypothetical protein
MKKTNITALVCCVYFIRFFCLTSEVCDVVITGDFLMPELWHAFLWFFLFHELIENHGVTVPLISVFYTCCSILSVIIGQTCNLLFISCEWIFNYTCIAVCNSISKLLCKSLWNYCWRNACIHSCWRFVMNSVYLNTLSFSSVSWNGHAMFWYAIRWYVPCALLNFIIWTGKKFLL